MDAKLTKYLPLNSHSEFHPTHYLVIQSPSSLASSIQVFIPSCEPDANATPSTLVDPSTPAYMTISRKSILHRSYQVTLDQIIVATISNSLRSLGHWSITLPPDSPHCSHPLHIRPVQVNSRVDFFVKDSVPYLWGMFDGGIIKSLFKAVGDDVIKVAEFKAHSQRRVDGIFAIDTQHIDSVVAMAACIACLKRVESWRM